MFLAGLSAGAMPLKSPGRPADVEEERRLFFVGLTRAREELILTAAPEFSPFLRELPEPVVQNIYAMDEETIKERGIDHLPETLGEAIDEFEEDAFLRNVLGEHIFYKYLEAKKEEWNVFRSQVTDWEIGEYLYKY